MQADVARLLDHATRRAIACAALDAALTIGEIADRLDTADGAIRTTVERLAREDLLVRSERPGRRARSSVATYQVSAIHADDVRELCRETGGPMLDQNSEVLLVPLTGLNAAAGVLARSTPSVIAWAVRTRDPRLSLMIGLRPDSTPQDRDALLLALRDGGVDCARLFIGESFLPSALFEYAAGVAAEANRRLPSGPAPADD